MENEELISLVWAISETVEIDSWNTEDIANLLECESEEVVDLINQARDCYYEKRDMQDREEFTEEYEGFE